MSHTIRAKSNRSRKHRRKLWLIRRQKKLLREKARKELRRKFGFHRHSHLHLNSYTKNSVSSDNLRKLTIVLPKRLDFETNYLETVSHLAVLREAVRLGRRIRSLDFSELQYISPSAALVLASEVDRWNQKIGGRLRARLDSWKEDIKRLLCQMGYFELLQLDRPKTIWPGKNTTFLPFKRGHASDGMNGPLAKQLRIEIEGIVGRDIKKHFLFEGLSEAITNVGQHAYCDIGDPTEKQWWLSASYDQEDQRLCVTFYDQGDGIPKTLPRSHIFEFIKGFLKAWPDSQKIKAAMEVGRTSSGMTERGKGLQNLVEFAKSHRIGNLSIYSLRGLYMQTFTNDGVTQTQEFMERDHHKSIGGTLIEWSVNL